MLTHPPFVLDAKFRKYVQHGNIRILSNVYTLIIPEGIITYSANLEGLLNGWRGVG